MLDFYLNVRRSILWFDFALVLDFYLMSEQVFYGLPCVRFLSNVRTSYFTVCLLLDSYLMSEQVCYGLPCVRFLSNVRTSILWFGL